MDNYLLDIIDRMLDKSDQILESGYDSSKSISWKAFREAEKVDTLDFVPQLIICIDKEKDKKRRDAAYFLLGHIGKNTNDTAALNYLIQRVDKETDKQIITSILDRIGDLKKPSGTNLQPLIRATQNDKWSIRYSAIQSLNNSVDPVAESILIEILDSSDDPFNLIYSNAVLNRIGTLRALPYLEKHLKSRKRDVKDSAKFAIEEILKRNKEENTNQQ